MIWNFLTETFDARALQFTLNYDKKAFKILGLISNELQDFNSSNYAIFSNAGLVTLSWNGQSNKVLKPIKLFKISIQAIQNIRLSDAFSLTSDLTKAEAYDSVGESSPIILNFNKNIGTSKIGAENDFALLSNVPNPFFNETMIRFMLPTQSEAQVTIFDETGRTLKVINRLFSKGYNELPLTFDHSSAKLSGVLFYQIKTATHSAVQRMILLK